MANKQLTTRGPSPTDLIEQNSKQIFESKLPLADRIFFWYGDKTPNLDGHIEFLGENGSTTVKMFFQLKSSEQEIIYHDCDRSFLNYCYQAAEPTFLVFVNIPRQKVYWEHITPAFITSILGITDLVTFDQQTKRINFSEEKIIDQNAPSLIKECRKHYQDTSRAETYNQEAAMRGKRISGQEPTIRKTKEEIKKARKDISSDQKQIKAMPEEKREEIYTFHDTRKKFNAILGNMADKLMLYYTFVYLLKPFYLDQRGEKKRKTLIKFLQVTDSQERFLIESLVNANLLGRVGDLIFVIQKEEAILILNHYIDAGQFNLEEITQLFSQDENQDR